MPSCPAAYRENTDKLIPLGNNPNSYSLLPTIPDKGYGVLKPYLYPNSTLIPSSPIDGLALVA
jgi:hypothetical protein